MIPISSLIFPAPQRSRLFPYTTLFRSEQIHADRAHAHAHLAAAGVRLGRLGRVEHLGAAESIDLHGLHVVPPYAKVCVAAAQDALLSRPWMWMHRYRIRFLTSSILMSSSYQEA